MSKREDLIKQCRYYHGEKESPYSKTPYDDDKLSWFWDMERVYVESNGEAGGEADYYKSINGKSYPGIPFELLTIMFTSWGKFSYDLKNGLDKFYMLIDDYLFIANDHFPENSIPNSK